MKKLKEETTKKRQKQYDKGQIFVKIMAGFLAVLMIVAAGGTLLFALMG